MNYLKKNFILFIFIISSFTILTALTAEYFFNKQPCQMCLYQRYPYYFIIIISAIFIILNWPKIYFLWISCSSFFVGLLFSSWHFGIEKNIFSPLASCSNSISDVNSTEELKNQILNQAIVSCSEVTWKLIGVSATTLNLLLNIVLISLCIIYLFKYYNDKKKKT